MLHLTAEEEAILAGDHGEIPRWALEMQVETGRFFGAERLVPVSGAHMMGDMEVMGDPGLALLRDLAERGARFTVPTTTNGLAAVKAAAAALEPRGVRVMDAPVGKGPWAAETGELTILMGGDAATCEAARPVLSLVGSTLHHCGPLGAGQVMKLANNLASCANIAVLAEAYALAKAGGADPAVLAELMPQTSADSWHARHTLNGKVLKGDFDPMFKLKLAAKDMRLIVEMARDLGMPSSCTEGALDWYEKGEAAGHGELDWGAVMLVTNPELKPA